MSYGDFDEPCENCGRKKCGDKGRVRCTSPSEALEILAQAIRGSAVGTDCNSPEAQKLGVAYMVVKRAIDRAGNRYR